MQIVNFISIRPEFLSLEFSFKEADVDTQNDFSKSWYIRNAVGCIVLATLSEMYDNSIHDVRREDVSERNPESDNVKIKEKAITEQKVVNESIFKVDSDTLTLIYYVTIAILVSILFPLSYWISLQVYNNLF